MDKVPRYLIVDSAALPDVFVKVLDAKRLLNTGQAHSVNEAARLAGISRSVFYKYKERVRPYDDEAVGRIVTLSAMLRDEAGVLSALTGLLYQNGANVLTINQNIPVDGIAPVSVTARMDNIRLSLGGLLAAIRQVDGVKNVEIVSGA